VRTVDRIVVHHSLTKDGQTVSWGAVTRHHVIVKGWDANGYHRGVELVGMSYEILVGRPVRRVGSHARGMNRGSVGVCFLGDFTLRPPPLAQLEKGADEIADLCAMLGLRVNRQTIVPHRGPDQRHPCPGAAFPLAELRRLVRQRL
jgi:hypothetical protein